MHTHTVSELAKDGEYAGNDAIVAFSRCYSMHVVIHQLNAPRWEIHAPHTAATLNTLHIAYLNGEHYCSIRPLLPAESACATPLLPQLSMESGKGEEKTHTSSQRATHTSNVSSTTLRYSSLSLFCYLTLATINTVHEFFQFSSPHNLSLEEKEQAHLQQH